MNINSRKIWGRKTRMEPTPPIKPSTMKSPSNPTGAVATAFTSRELGKKIEAVEAIRSHLNTNVQEILALEVAFVRAFG